MPNQPLFRGGRLLWVAMLTLVSVCAHATSIRQLQLDEVISASMLIFAGEVIHSKSEWNETRSRIKTRVTFRVDQTIKGAVNDGQVELVFAGGSVGDVEQRIEAMIYPGVGESGVYFVADPSHTFVHPLVGWSQGHYKSQMIDGQVRMVTATDKPIMAMQGQSKAAQKNSSEIQLSVGHAGGIATGQAAGGAMSQKQFVDFIGRRIDASK